MFDGLFKWMMGCLVVFWWLMGWLVVLSELVGGWWVGWLNG